MNPLTLDFIRRWKWLLVVQLVTTTAAWGFHAKVPQARLHLEVLVAIAMSWDLLRGLVRVQLGLPQRRDSIAAGLWLSVVAVGAGTHLAGMVLGGVLLGPLLGQGMDPGAMSLHAFMGLILIGTVQFILTGLPSTPPRTLAGQVKGTIFAALWGLPMFGSFWLAFFAPADWAAVKAWQAVIMGVLGMAAVASWFTTRGMMMERAMPKQEAAPPGPAGDPRSILSGNRGWRLWLEQEGRWLLPVLAMVLMAGLIMTSINDFAGGGGSGARQQGSYQYRSMGMLCVILAFPLVAVAAGSLRAFRSLPVPLSSFALVVAVRPFAGGLVVFFGYALLNRMIGRSPGMEGQALAAFLPLCALMSLLQALILRYPRLPAAFGLLMVLSMVSALLPEVIKLALPASVPMLLGGVLLLISWGLHVRFLGKSSEVYRLSQGFLRMVGGGGGRR